MSEKMTKREYVGMLAKLYAVANMADSDNPMRPDWLKGDEASEHCRAIDKIVHHMGLTDLWGNLVEGDCFELIDTIDVDKLDEFTRGYIECALWSSVDNKERPMDARYCASDIVQGSLRTIVADCAEFQRLHASLLNQYYEARGCDASYAGHDFWLTRNGHGAGFWDRGLGALGDELTTCAKAYGTCGLYIGDDNLVYVA